MVCEELGDDYRLGRGAVSSVHARWRKIDLRFGSSLVYWDAAIFTAIWLMLHGRNDEAWRLPYRASAGTAASYLSRSGIRTYEELMERTEKGTKRIPATAVDASIPTAQELCMRTPVGGDEVRASVSEAPEVPSSEARYRRVSQEVADLTVQRNRLVVEKAAREAEQLRLSAMFEEFSARVSKQAQALAREKAEMKTLLMENVRLKEELAFIRGKSSRAPTTVRDTGREEELEREVAELTRLVRELRSQQEPRAAIIRREQEIPEERDAFAKRVRELEAKLDAARALLVRQGAQTGQETLEGFVPVEGLPEGLTVGNRWLSLVYGPEVRSFLTRYASRPQVVSSAVSEIKQFVEFGPMYEGFETRRMVAMEFPGVYMRSIVGAHWLIWRQGVLVLELADPRLYRDARFTPP
ncbi:MAG: hypothetical protein G01um1014106_470 [Parcubacteria group bacterium Gr01-1014_106]|nr:MAG: hypothetical protein G01um1014106_470 [Parcubacteria group bacterium Gr01-1014_106]